ncbi:ribosome biogenesis protein SLX9 homolog [Corticium candelabrum]|uniref:ribosome biogenesis protein SLX9 homolog n=1 Tax=Corticium candelabrum TaxID=121492 RepID=UPI002E272E1B|nr:ribosome biogenesis protein SLX9 homolog [Corticium candelabrum]
MGKLRRSRTKRHISSVRPEKSEISDTNTKSYAPIPEEFMSKAAVVRLVDQTADSSGRDHDGGDRSLSKKERQKIRREKWLKKIDATQAQNKPKHHHTPVIVGDLEPLKSALTELEHVSHNTPKKARKPRATDEFSPSKKSLTRKHRQRVLKSEVERFHKVLQDKAFKEDPIEAITQHIQYTVKQTT